jgi:hypothetical protein
LRIDGKGVDRIIHVGRPIKLYKIGWYDYGHTVESAVRQNVFEVTDKPYAAGRKATGVLRHRKAFRFTQAIVA